MITYRSKIICLTMKIDYVCSLVMYCNLHVLFRFISGVQLFKDEWIQHCSCWVYVYYCSVSPGLATWRCCRCPHWSSWTTLDSWRRVRVPGGNWRQFPRPCSYVPRWRWHDGGRSPHQGYQGRQSVQYLPLSAHAERAVRRQRLGQESKGASIV